MDFGNRTVNPLFRGSTILEEASRVIAKSKVDSSDRRGQSLSRIIPNDVNKCQSEVVCGQRRGCSVSQNHSTNSQNTSNQMDNVDSE